MIEKVITNLDQHGRMLIPSQIRERFNINAGDKITLEIDNNELKIRNISYTINEIHNIFMKNNTDKNKSVTDDFISTKRDDFKTEQSKNIKK